MSEARDIELLFAIWEQNVDTVRALNRSLKQEALPKSGIAPQLVSHLKQCAIALVKPGNQVNGSDQRQATAVEPSSSTRPKIDKSVLAINEPKRIRCMEHLRFVASQPCLICGRLPSHAHHIRYAQSKGLGLKVSDEFTVAALRHPPSPHPHHRQGTGMVGGAQISIPSWSLAACGSRAASGLLRRARLTYREFWRMVDKRQSLANKRGRNRGHTRSHRRASRKP